MRVALCFSGMVRTLMLTLPSIQEFLLEPFSPDVFVHTWDRMGLKESADRPVTSQWLNSMLPVTSCAIKTSSEYDKKFARERDLLYTVPGPILPTGAKPEEWMKLKNVLTQLWHVHQCDLLRREHERKHDFTYDIVIRARMDNLFTVPLAPLGQHRFTEYPTDAVFVPEHGGFGGYCDQFAIGSSVAMERYCDYYPNFESMWRSRPLLKDAYGLPERFLKRYLTNVANLKVYRFTFPFELQRESEVVRQSRFTDDWYGLNKQGLPA